MKEKILIADDDPVAIKLLEHTLKDTRYALIVCREGFCVQALIEEEKPVLAILDLMLPGKSGLEIIEDLKKDSKDAFLLALPIIVITQQGKRCTKNQLLAAGASSVFTKPFSPKLLLARINELTTLKHLQHSTP